MNNKWKKISIGLLILLIAYVWYNNNTQKKLSKETTKKIKKVPVAVRYAGIKEFQDDIKVQGNVSAKNFVHVSPKLDGVLENIFLDEGDKVVKGKTDLFQTEKLKYQKIFEIKKQDQELARCNLNVSEANLERVGADFKKAEIDYNRFKRLYEKKAITKDQMEIQESRFLQVGAALKQAEALLKLSKEQEKQAKASFEMAEKDLTDTLIKAPIDGVITKKYAETGEMGKFSKTVLRIDDLKVVEVKAFVPSEFYFKVLPQKTEVNIFYNGEKIKNAVIEYKSPVVNETLRTFEIKFSLENNDNSFVPGMLLDLELVFEKRTSIGVPFSSILQKRNGQVVYVAENGISKLKQVQTGLRTNGWIEIKSKNIKEKELIITEGQFILKDGLAIKIRKGAS